MRVQCCEDKHSAVWRVGLAAVCAIFSMASAAPFFAQSGGLFGWGDNEYGQLGNGTWTNSNVPVQVSGLTGITAIARGGLHSLALKNDGTVWAWGNNGSGQLGNGTNSNSNIPVQVSGLTGIITAIAGGDGHSLALKSDGTVWAWGQNHWGQLGNGTYSDSSVPVQVSGLTGITKIAGGGSHSLALKSDGAVWAWGGNYYGQLGNGRNSDSSVPVQVSGLTGIITAIAGGNWHSLALKSDGTVWAWGDNGSGQLGDGTYNWRNVPVPVSDLTGITAIAGGGVHSLALKNDGTVWAWGYNGYGQLGNGTYSNSNVPVPVSGLTGITAIAWGWYHSLALKNDGTAWAWGYNGYGQLGNGTLTTSNAPVQVSSLTGITAIAGGDWHSLAILESAASCTANAGASQTVLAGQTAALNGGASSCTTGPPTSYLWTLVSKPAGSYAVISNYTSATASLTPDVAGVYTVSLVVSNGSATSDPAYTTVTANACAQGLTVYPSRPTVEPGEAVTITAWGGSTSFTWSLSQNQSGATLSPSGATCRYTAGTAQGKDIIHIMDTTCGSSIDVTATVQALPPQVTEAHFCPNPTSGATTTTLYATFNGSVQGAQYMCVPGAWTAMSGSGTNWQATVPVPNPGVNARVPYAVKGVTSTAFTAVTQTTLNVSPNQSPILLVHGWHFTRSCVNDCDAFDTIQRRLAQENYDARLVTGIDSWGELFCLDPQGRPANSGNAFALKKYIDDNGLAGRPIVLVGHSMGGLIVRAFLALYPDYAKNVKDVITIDTPHDGSPWADILPMLNPPVGIPLNSVRQLFGSGHADGDKALKWLAPGRTDADLSGYVINNPTLKFYEIGSYRTGVLKSDAQRLFFDLVFGLGYYTNDCVVSMDSQWGFWAGTSQQRSIAYQSQVPAPAGLLPVLHTQILGPAGSPDYEAFYSNVFLPVIHEILPPNTASCTPGFAAQPLKAQAPQAAVIPSATRARVLVNQSGTATVGVESTVTVTVESTLQATFGVSLSGGTASVWLTTPSSSVINPASANGDSIKYDYSTDTGMEQHVYTLRAPAAGAWTVHILPSATDPGGLSYTVTAQDLSTLGMSASASPTDLLPGDAVVVSATLLKATAPVTGATVSATLNFPDGSTALLDIYDDGAHQDGAADDGVYANSYSGTAQSGGFSLTVNASGTDGSLGAWQRTANANFNVGRVAGAFTGVYTESAPDADANGKLDALVITAGVSVSESGDYRVVGDLKDQNGKICASASASLSASVPDSYTVKLSFNGKDIFENSALGPYTLTNLRLYKSGTLFSLSDKVNDAYTTTGSYLSWMNFESKDVPLFQFVKPVMDEVVLGNSYTIGWKTGDGYANAVISLYYDSTGTGFAGTPITGAQRLRKDDPAKSFAWDMTALPEGKYFVYALIQDGSYSDALYGGSVYKTLDTDGDGMPDSWETAHTLDLNNAADSLLDPDADGLNNLQEYQASTDPHVADTDGGGENDGSEVFNGRNPLVGSDDVVAVQLTQVTPAAGTTAGGQQVQLRGIHFLAGATVNFGGMVGTSVQVMDGQNILVTTPAHAAGAVAVNVVNPGGATGTLAGGFTYQANPGLTGASPGTVATHGGTTVTLAGSEFSTPMRVLFGSSEGSSVTVGAPSSMTVVTPVLAAGSVNVTALNQGYQSTTLTGALTAVDIPPVEVTGLDVTKASGGIALSWTPVTLAQDGYAIQPTKYSIYRSETLPISIDVAHRIATTAGDVTSWVDSSSGATEYYLVTASYQSAEGPAGSGLSPVPNGSLLWAASGKNALSWFALSGATGYRVYRGAPGELTNLPTGAAACRSFDGAGTTTGATQTAVPPAGSFYWYLVVGYNASGEGSAGNGTLTARKINSTGTCP